MASKTEAEEQGAKGVPVFRAVIPDELMEKWHTLEPVMRCLLKNQSLQDQKMDWIMVRLGTGDEVIAGLERRVEGMQKMMVCGAHAADLAVMGRDVGQLKAFKVRLTAKSSVMIGLAAAVALPVGLAVVNTLLRKLWP